jgi:hypothetical protein
MMTKLLAFKWTCLFGLAFLGSFVWSVVSSDGVSDISVLVCSLAFLASVLVSVVTALKRRSSDSLYRLLVNVAFCLLLFAAVSVGGTIRDRIFLTRLPKFQEATDILVKNEMTKAGDGDVAAHVVSLPPGFSDLNVADYVLIRSAKGNITVRYSLKNSNALSHRGFMYRSDDSEIDLSKAYPKTGYTHLAPHWFFFSE